MHMRLEHLRDRLLREGIASRHVRRYLSELEDHYDDAVRDEVAQGLSREAASQAAWARLGDMEGLALSALAKPELRSVLARFPRIIFGAGPIVLWIVAIVGTAWSIALISDFLGHDPNVHKAPASWINAPVQVAVFFYNRMLPVVFGALAVTAALRHGMRLTWPLIGAAAISIFAGSTDITVTLPTADAMGELQVFNSIMPALGDERLGAVPSYEIARGLVIAGVNLALILTPLVLWRRRSAIA